MLTPIDIQNHVLKSTMGGYNKKETDEFIDSIQVCYEQLYKENHDLKEKITALSDGLQYYKQMEGTLQKTLVLAEKTASETLTTSKNAAEKVEIESREKAEIMLNEAKARAERLVRDAQAKANAITTESQVKADALTSEAQAQAEAVTSEAQSKADALTSEAQEKADQVTSEAEAKAASLTSEAQEKADQVTSEAEAKAETLTLESQKKADETVAEAEKKSKNILANANERADRIMEETKQSTAALIRDTKKKADEMVVDSNVQIKELASVLNKLKDSYEEYKVRFKELLNKQLEDLESEKYVIDIEGLDALLESQEVAMAEAQTETAAEIDKITENTDQLDLPVEDTAPEGEEDEEVIEEEVVSEENEDSEGDLLGGLDIPLDVAATEEEETAENTLEGSFDFDTTVTDTSINFEPTTDSETAITVEDILHSAMPQGEAPDIDALVAAAASVTGESTENPVKEEESKEDSSTKESNSLFNKKMSSTFGEVNSMLGTSYDDVPMNSFTGGQSFESDFSSSTNEETTEIPATTAETEPEPEKEELSNVTDELPTVQETYDPENYITSETYFGSADNMSYSIPDPSESKDNPVSDIPVPNFDEAANIPMPDFSSSKPDIPMPDFGAAADIPMPNFGATDVSASDFSTTADVPMPDFGATAEEVSDTDYSSEAATTETDVTGPTVQESYNPEEYITSETYFGSADNMSYNIPDKKEDATSEDTASADAASSFTFIDAADTENN